MLAIIITLLHVLLAPDADVDGDQSGALDEYLAGCNPRDYTSRPYCLPGAEVPGSCSSSIPGAELEPC